MIKLPPMIVTPRLNKAGETNSPKTPKVYERKSEKRKATEAREKSAHNPRGAEPVASIPRSLGASSPAQVAKATIAPPLFRAPDNEPSPPTSISSRPSLIPPEIDVPVSKMFDRPPKPSGYEPNTKTISELMEEKNPTINPIPTDIRDDPKTLGPDWVRMGASDPLALAKSWEPRPGTTKRSPVEPTPLFDRLVKTPFKALTGQDYEGSEFGKQSRLEAGLSTPWWTTVDIINDVTSRIASLRSDLANDPDTWVDDPIYEYPAHTDPEGRPYTSEDRKRYYDVGGRIISYDEANSITGADPITITDPRDPRQALLQPDENGNMVYYRSWRLPDNTTIPREALPTDDAGWQKALVYYGLPDGTVTMYADGTVPEDMREMEHREIPRYDKRYKDTVDERIELRQQLIDMGLEEDEPLPDRAWYDRLIDPFIGPVSPRSPIEDTQGNKIWNVPFNPLTKNHDYDIRKSAINEAIPWFIDMNLGSLPYYNKYTRYPAAMGRSAPYLLGYDANRYAPEGWGLGDLDKIGQGAYPNNEQTTAQILGGFIGPWVDAWAERASGQAIGGIPKFIRESRFGDMFGGGPVRRTLSGGAMEGMEEVFASPFQQLQQDSWEDFGRERYWNEETGEWVYDKSSPRGSTTPETLLEDWFAGFALGTPMTGVAEAKQYLQGRDRGHRGQTPHPAPAAVNPRTHDPADVLSDEDLGAIRRNYSKD